MPLPLLQLKEKVFVDVVLEKIVDGSRIGANKMAVTAMCRSRMQDSCSQRCSRT